MKYVEFNDIRVGKYYIIFQFNRTSNARHVTFIRCVIGLDYTGRYTFKEYDSIMKADGGFSREIYTELKGKEYRWALLKDMFHYSVYELSHEEALTNIVTLEI